MTVTVLKSAVSQDIHFSQIHASPNQINPALTGLFNGGLRFIGNYKNQWKSVTADYNTYFASLDGKILYSNNHDFVSAGIKAYSDNAGDLNFSKKEASAALAVTKSINQTFENYITIGTELGWMSQSADLSKAHGLDNEFDPSIVAANSQNALDFSAGINWHFKVNKMLFYAGTALYHINRPTLGSSDANTQERLYRKVVVNAGGEIKASSRITVMPSLIYYYQGPYREITSGTYIRHKLNTSEFGGRRFFYYGAWLRWYHSLEFNSGYDAVIAAVRLDNGSFSYSVSYDVTVSSLTNTGKFTGSPEFSIIYIMDEKVGLNIHGPKRVNTNCPEF